MKAITQLDIARACGVSRTTVAYSFHPELQSQIGQETRQHVLDMAQSLGYRPDRRAQQLRGKKSGMIGIIKSTGIVQASVERSFFVAQAIQEADYGLLVNELHWDKHGLRRAVDTMVDERVEGVLLTSLSWGDEAIQVELQRLRDAKIPMVALGGNVFPFCPTVISDFRQGMADMTRHLLSSGRRKLTLVCVARAEELILPNNFGFAQRVAGFREVAAAAGLSAEEAKVLHQPHLTGWSDTYSVGQAAVEQLVARGERPEALLCSNDDGAVGAIDACVAAGWRVPEDLAITGVDNNTFGRYVRPRLTTLAQPSEATAKKAVELLLKQMRGETISASEWLVKLPCKLVVRESCRKAKRLSELKKDRYEDK